MRLSVKATFVCVAVLPFVASATTLAADVTPRNLLVYSEALAPGWRDASEGQINLGVRAPVYRRLRAIAFTTTAASSRLGLVHDGAIGATAYSYLSFAARAAVPGQRYSLRLLDATGAPMAAVFAFEPSAESWTPYDVALPGLRGTSTALSGFEIVDEGGRAGTTLYVDEIELLPAGATPQPARGRKPAGWDASLQTVPPNAAAGGGFGIASTSGVHVLGNQLVDDLNHPVFVHGVNRSGTEYACIQGFGIFDGPNDQASLDAIKSWNANAIRVPLNEDCWLNINGVDPAYGGTNYITAISNYVALLTSSGLIPILELHWTAPGATPATGQNPMPDQDHSIAFWQSVANTFKTSAAVVFEPFNEPYPDDNNDTVAAWTCWRDGGTTGGCTQAGFAVAGMQSLVDAIRGTGATNVIALGGVEYSNALSQWLTYKPTDAQNQLAAAWHVYNFNACSDTTCYDANAKPVAQQVPLLTTEIGDNVCDATFMNTLMSWIEGQNQSYLAWTWDTWGTACGTLALIQSYDGTPTTYGTIYKDHLAGLSSPLTLERNALRFGASRSGGTLVATTPAQIVGLTTAGTWTAASNQPFVSVSPTSGSGSALLTIQMTGSTTGLPTTGAAAATITVTPGGPGLAQTIAVSVQVYAAGATAVPFGSFDTPNGGTDLTGAIPVTGWALDDIGVDHVELWRDPVNGDPAPAPNGKIFIANAIFVSGARPDVESQYGTYPQAYRGAWGYMLLTNLLPRSDTGAPAGGFGAFTLYADVYDVEGHLTTLSPRTFTCNNVLATKPFGTIDTPAQGAVVSGNLDNFGWALTPNSTSGATIPTDGSTVQVFVDGVLRGTALYNLPRNDVQTLFPGYTNSAGPVGYFAINTTTLANGVHTIFWIVTDDQNRAEGIGSRYFTVLN